MAYTDRTLVCGDCMARFTFTSQDQEEYALAGGLKAPSRCPDCRVSRDRLRAAKAAMPPVVSRRRY